MQSASKSQLLGLPENLVPLQVEPAPRYNSSSSDKAVAIFLFCMAAAFAGLVVAAGVVPASLLPHDAEKYRLWVIGCSSIASLLSVIAAVKAYSTSQSKDYALNEDAVSKPNKHPAPEDNTPPARPAPEEDTTNQVLSEQEATNFLKEVEEILGQGPEELASQSQQLEHTSDSEIETLLTEDPTSLGIPTSNSESFTDKTPEAQPKSTPQTNTSLNSFESFPLPSDQTTQQASAPTIEADRISLNSQEEEQLPVQEPETVITATLSAPNETKLVVQSAQRLLSTSTEAPKTKKSKQSKQQRSGCLAGFFGPRKTT